MDTTVAALGDVIVTALKDADYMQSTINQYSKSIKWLGVLAEEQDGQYTRTLGKKFASMTISPRSGKYSAQRHFDYGRLVCCSTRTYSPAPWICPCGPVDCRRNFPTARNFQGCWIHGLKTWSREA